MNPDSASTGPNGDGASTRQIDRAPAVAAAEPRAWQSWLARLWKRGREAVATLGVVLLAGFLLGLGAVLFFALLADEVLDQTTLVVDTAVLLALRAHQSSALDSVAQAFSMLGAEGLTVLFVVTLIVLGWQRRYGAAVSLMLVVGGAQLLNDVLKLAFHRTRPSIVVTAVPGQVWSFPSGHAMVSLAFFGFLAYLGWRLFNGRWRVVWVCAMSLLVLLIGLSRLYLGVHYLTDVVAGYIAGFIWLDTVIVGGELLERAARSRRALLLPRRTATGSADRGRE
jgi:membrane-associated phospholipid phosphatase